MKRKPERGTTSTKKDSKVLRRRRASPSEQPSVTPESEKLSEKPVVPKKENLKHYCRLCPKEFETTDELPAHALCGRHYRSDHRPIAKVRGPTPMEVHNAACDSNCLTRELPDELHAGRRLYGPGVQSVKPIMKYEEAFPNDEPF